MRYSIKKINSNYSDKKAYQVYRNNKPVMVGLGEYNEFPTKKEAIKFLKEVKEVDKN